MSDTVRITIKLITGDVQVYELDRVDRKDANRGTRLQKMLESQYLYFELEDRVSVIPVANVLSMEISPKPLVSPPYAIPDVREAD